MYSLDVVEILRFAAHAQGRPFHAATVTFGPRSGASAPHGHADFFEFMAVLEGTGGQRLAIGMQQLTAGDVVLVRPHDRHQIFGTLPTGVTFVNVAFPAHAWRGFIDLTGVDPNNRWDSAAAPPMRSGVPSNVLRATFDDPLVCYHGNPTTLDLVRFWSAAIELFDEHPASDDANGSGCPDWLTRACIAMRREENLQGGVPRLLELAAVSPAHLSRSMRLYNGVTPTQFVADLRLEHAAALLVAEAATVTEIAYRCGFSSPSYFTRCFRDAHHTSPRVFRRNSRRAFIP